MKREASTDLWVYDLLKDAGLGYFSPPGQRYKRNRQSLKVSIKKGTKKHRLPRVYWNLKRFF